MTAWRGGDGSGPDSVFLHICMSDFHTMKGCSKRSYSFTHESNTMHVMFSIVQMYYLKKNIHYVIFQKQHHRKCETFLNGETWPRYSIRTKVCRGLTTVPVVFVYLSPFLLRRFWSVTVGIWTLSAFFHTNLVFMELA